MNWISLPLSALAGLLLLPTAIDLVARLRAVPGSRRRPTPPPGSLPRLLFLVPAHDEELLIGACVRSLVDLRYPADRCHTVVIADNCSDRTAELAREAGASCLTRFDRAHPGKPHAIAWALGQLDWPSYDAVVIIDADSEIDPAFGVELARFAPLRGKAVQGYHQVLNPGDSALTRLGALLGDANHRFAYPVKQRGGLNTPLLGNGMAIGTDVLAQEGWRAFSICEDWEMYAVLSTAGVRIDGAPLAKVASQEARTLAQSGSQRRRWTAGKLTVLGLHAGPLLESTRTGLLQKLDVLTELAMPGPVLHLGIAVGGATVALLMKGSEGALLASLLLGSLLRPAWYTLQALRRDPDPLATIRALTFLPWYTLWRLGVGLASLTMIGDRPWVRTGRHASTHPRHV